ncbi:MAG: hypothetical protein R2875_03845 [Desulfobacterales bacterium]
MVENALTIPLNIPLGVCFTENGNRHAGHCPSSRFLLGADPLDQCGVGLFSMAFPPCMSSIHHVVINSVADEQLGLRTGISSYIVPNVSGF